MLNRIALALVVAAAILPAAPAFAQLRPLPRPTPTPGPGGHVPVVPAPAHGTYDPVVADAVREARYALNQVRRFEYDLERAATDRERAALLGYMEQASQNALEAIYRMVEDTRRDSPANRVLVYQIARDALGSGNRSGDPAARIAYNVDALRKISVLPTR